MCIEILRKNSTTAQQWSEELGVDLQVVSDLEGAGLGLEVVGVVKVHLVLRS